MATCFFLINELDSAQLYQERSTELRLKFKSTDVIMNYANLARIYNARKEYLKALEYLDKGYALFDSSDYLFAKSKILKYQIG